MADIYVGDKLANCNISVLSNIYDRVAKVAGHKRKVAKECDIFKSNS